MKQLFTLLAAVLFTASSYAQVGIGTTTPEASAALDITSTTKGLLPPRVTEAQRDAISTAAAGLIVYCTDCGANGELQFYNGTSWVNMEGGTATAGPPIPSVVSTTGKTWMDRNLGATQVATSSTDAASYGDLYQWGRATDGHEKRISTVVAGPVASGSEGANFITNGTAPSDWLSTQDDTRWNSGTEAAPVKVTANDPCPTGFRVPTETELEAERNNGGTGFWGGSLQNNAAGAFASVLKLPVAGYRLTTVGTRQGEGSYGRYWSSTVNGTYARRVQINSSNANVNSNGRAGGCPVRCIKE
jgi:uncharacterized protein (TIGR02145 family)